MNSTELYSNLLNSLSDLRNFMMSDTWIDAVTGSTTNVQKQAFNAAFDVQHAINVLSNQILSDIADDMAAQDDAIQNATQKMEASINTFSTVNKTLGTITKLLAVVGQIVSLV